MMEELGRLSSAQPSPLLPGFCEVRPMEPNQPAPRPKRWRVSLPVSLGVVLFLASLVIAARSIRSHAGDSPTYSAPAVKPAEDSRWMSLGYVDIEGGVTPLYPLQL